MFEDEKELNNPSTNGSGGANPNEGEVVTPEYVNADDNVAQYDNMNQNSGDYNSRQSTDSDYQNTDDAHRSSGNTYYDQSAGYNQGSYYDHSNGYSNQGNSYGSQDNSFNNQDNNYSNQRNYYDYNSNGTNYDNYYSGQNNNQQKDKKNGNKKIAIIAAVAVTAVVVIGGIKIISDSVMESANKAFEKIDGSIPTDKEEDKKEYPTIGSTVTDDDKAENATGTSGVMITDVSNVVDSVMPSIVAITSTTIVESNIFDNDWFWGGGYGEGYNEEYEQVGAGSGIIVKQTDSELLIVTNNHVVQGADSLSIQFANGTSINGATKSTDEEADIAIVSIPLEDIDNDTMEAIKIATLGSSDDLRVGEGVVAIGNALGYGQSVTTGVISAKDRDIAVDNKTMTVLQTDAAINGGNSGGALLNSKGEVIGINVAKYSSSSYSGSATIEGMGFAIPISQATDIINNLMTKETRTKVDEEERGYLGISIVDADATAAEMYSIPQGIFVRDVNEGGAADKAGVKPADVIVKFDGQSVSTRSSLIEKLEYYKAGEKVMLTVMRNSNGEYKEIEIEVELGSAETVQEQTNR